ncbi:MAG: glycosyltransferase family 4 protein [Sedimentisphaerales bacterium]|nr:glycosyltransferase family 4 protein [Sedimentisphaerales bacterium]
MRIIALGFRGFPQVQGGIERHCERLYPRLVNFGCEITVLSRTPYTGRKPFNYKGVRIFPVWSPKHKFLETLLHTGIASLFAILRKPDLIHIHAVGPSLFIPFIKSQGARVIATHHGFDYARAKWGNFAKRFLRLGEKQICKADKIIAVSEHIGAFLQDKYNCSVSFIPNGVDLPEIIPPDTFCKKWNIKSGKYFLFVGRLVPEKCVHDLFDAFSRIKTSWKLIIAGDADHTDIYSRNLRLKASKLDNIIMTGFITGKELQELFSNAGGFILPSSHEGLPIALLEALSFGLPCIASDIAPNRAISHPTVEYFPVHDVTALAKCLINLTETQSPFDRSAGRAYVATNFNWDIIAGQTYELFKQIVS